jgi:HlyD family secretion protein
MNAKAYFPVLTHHRKGELVFSEGASGQTAYIVRRGEVNIVKHAGAQGQVVLKTLGPGELFGEMALITSNPRSASVVAASDVELEVLDRHTFGDKVRSDPEFSVQMVRRLAAMVPDTQAKLLKHFEGAAAIRDAQAPAAPSWWERLTGLGGDRGLAAGFEPAHVRIEQDQSDRLLTLGASTVTLFVLAGILASFWIEVDQMAQAAGRLVTERPPLSVQSVEAGVVRQVHVLEGQRVRKGDRLVTLDPTMTDADYNTVRTQWMAAQAQMRRVEAEINGVTTFAPSGDRMEDSLQTGVLQARQQQHRSTLASHEADITALQRQLASRQTELPAAERQVEASRQLAAVRKDLFDKEREAYQRDGVYRLQYLDAQRNLATAERDLTALRGQIDSLQAQTTARMAQRDAYISDWRSRLGQEQTQQTRELARLGEQLRKMDRSQTYTTLVAPDDGVVLSIKTKVPGTVVRSADTVVDLVADDSRLQVEVDVNPRDIAHVKAGRPADIKFDTLPYVRHGSLQAEVIRVSEDTFERTLNNTPGPVYRARLKLTGAGGNETALRDTPAGFRLQPGMTLSADILAGRRPLSAVVFYPVAKALGNGLREP